MYPQDLKPGKLSFAIGEEGRSYPFELTASMVEKIKSGIAQASAKAGKRKGFSIILGSIFEYDIQFQYGTDMMMTFVAIQRATIEE